MIVPAGPADRPVERRRAVRVLLIDPDESTLLFQDSDPGLTPAPRWWMTPGGGVDPGETDEAAAVREVLEETGWRADESALLGPLATRHVRHGYSDKIVLQDEVFFALHVPRFEIDTVGHTDEEQLTVTDHRWWPRPTLTTSTERIWPPNLEQIWHVLDQWPCAAAHLGESEESTVAID